MRYRVTSLWQRVFMTSEPRVVASVRALLLAAGNRGRVRR